jgi:uncharacterized protein (DUF4415 family)
VSPWPVSCFSATFGNNEMKKEKWLKTVELEKRPTRKALFTLRIDPAVADWYRQQKPYNPLIEAILRAYMEAHQ